MSYFNYNEFDWDVSNLLDEACDTAKDNVRYEVDSAIESAFDDIDMESLLKSVWDRAQEEAREDIEDELNEARVEANTGLWETMAQYFNESYAADPKKVFAEWSPVEFVSNYIEKRDNLHVGDEVTFTEYGDDNIEYRGCIIQMATDIHGNTSCAVMECNGDIAFRSKTELKKTGKSYPQLFEIFNGLNVELA